MSSFSLTTPFSVHRQPFGPHCGHKRDGGLPPLQAFSSVLQLQDPGEGFLEKTETVRGGVYVCVREFQGLGRLLPRVRALGTDLSAKRRLSRG